MSSSHSLWRIWWISICALPHFDDLPANIDVSWFGLTKPTGFDGFQRASCGQAARIWWIENAACVVWKALLRTIWPVSHHLSHISSSAFSIQAGEKHPSWPTRRSPQMGKSGSSQSSPGASLALVPPRFYNALQLLRKALLGNKNSLCKWATSEKESCHWFFRRSHGLIHYTATGSEQRHLWAPLEVCIQIHTKKKKKNSKAAVSFRIYESRSLLEAGSQGHAPSVVFCSFCLSSITDEAYYYSSRGKMAILTLLLLECLHGKMISCETFETVSSQTLSSCSSLMGFFIPFIQRNTAPYNLPFKIQVLIDLL